MSQLNLPNKDKKFWFWDPYKFFFFPFYQFLRVSQGYFVDIIIACDCTWFLGASILHSHVRGIIPQTPITMKFGEILKEQENNLVSLSYARTLFCEREFTSVHIPKEPGPTFMIWDTKGTHIKKKLSNNTAHQWCISALSFFMQPNSEEEETKWELYKSHGWLLHCIIPPNFSQKFSNFYFLFTPIQTAYLNLYPIVFFFFLKEFQLMPSLNFLFNYERFYQLN